MPVLNSKYVRCLLLLITVATAASSARAQEAKKTPLTIDDLYRFESYGSQTLSPNRKILAATRSWIDSKSKQQRYSLWVSRAADKMAAPLEEGQPDARVPMFSPDGKWIVFLSIRRRPQGWRQTRLLPPQSEAATDIWLIPTAGGEAIPLAGPNKPYGRVFGDRFYGRIAFSPDGKRLVFVADDGKINRSQGEVQAGVQIVRPDQGEGYTGLRNAQIWVAHLDFKNKDFAADRVERLTDDNIWYGDPQWSPDGKSIVVHANRTKDRESVRYSINKNYDLWRIDVQTKKIQQLTFGPGPEVSPRFSSDGRRLACLSVPRKGPHADIYNVGIVSLDKQKPKMRIVFDQHNAEGKNPPHLPPSFPLPQNCWDGGDHLVYNAATGTSNTRQRLDLASGKAVVPAAKPTSSDGRLRMPASNAFLQQRLIAPWRVVRWENEGLQLEGILTVPHESIAKPPYKLVLYPHGGPHSRSTTGFNFTTQIFAAKGYAVFQPNFRGSYGYGLKFLDADQGDFGGGDMRDILSGIESLIKAGLVDRQRQFVYGVSYGGFMTSWLIGHTNQFRAAVPQNAVTDLNMMWGLSDLQSWTEWEFGGRPWEVPDAMRKHSPITYAGKVKTPTLVLHSRADRRCPLPMGQAFYLSLKKAGVPCQMVIYPREGHGIRQPKHRADVLRRTLAWFAKYDKQSSPR